MASTVSNALTTWTQTQVSKFVEINTSLEDAFLSTITGDVAEGSGFVIKMGIFPMAKKKSKGKKSKDDDEDEEESVIVEFTLSDGKYSVPCAIHNAPDTTFDGGCEDSDEFKKYLSALVKSQRQGYLLCVEWQYRTYRNKRLFIISKLTIDKNSKESQLTPKQVKTFLSKCSKAKTTPLEIMCEVLWSRFFAPIHIKKAIMLFCLNPFYKHELIHIGIITSHGEGKDTLVEEVIQPLVPCGFASSGQMTTIPGLFGAMSSDDLSSVDVGLMPKMNHERLAISEFQLWKDTVFGELMGAMANGFVQLTKGKLDIKKPTCTNVLMLGNPPHDYEDGQAKIGMMEAFGRYTPQIVSRLTLIFTQLKLNPDDKTAQVEEIIVKNMEQSKANKEVEIELNLWRAFFREYLRYMSQQEIPLMDSYGIIKSVYDSLKAKEEFGDIFHARGITDNRKWAEFVNLCRAFSRINGNTEITNDDIRQAYTLMLESLRTLTEHFDIEDIGRDLSPLMQKIYLEVKKCGAIETASLSKQLKVKVKTVENCMKKLQTKRYVQKIGDAWVVCSDEMPNEEMRVETKPTQHKEDSKVDNIGVEPSIQVSDEISDELLDELEKLMEREE